MVKIYIYYSYTHDKFITKYITGVNLLEVGHVNQFNQELIQIIDINDLRKKSRLNHTIERYRYVKKINSLYKEDIKSLKRERKEKISNAIISRRHSSRHY